MRSVLVMLMLALAGCGAPRANCVCRAEGVVLVCGDSTCDHGHGWTCGANGALVEAPEQCPTVCTPDCSGKSCGADGCGGVCGTCAKGQCDDTGACVTIGLACTPTSDKSCQTGERCVRDATGHGVCAANDKGKPCNGLSFCTEGFLCMEGVCEARCTGSTDCRSAENCIVTTTTDKVCHAACTILGGPCPSGTQCTGVLDDLTATSFVPVCIDIGPNVEGEGCLATTDCGVGLTCVNSLCTRMCDPGHPCAGGVACTPLTISGRGTPYGACLPVKGPCSVAGVCTQANRTTCAVAGHVAVCTCNAGFTDDNGTCRDNTPCTPNPCSGGNRNTCVPSGLGFTCACDAGFTDDNGTCRDSTPCSPNPCTGGNRTQCTPSGFTFACGCDAGFTDDAGVCRDNTPCSPNPCTGANQTQCTATGFTFTCGCDPGSIPSGGGCKPGCAGGSHSDGDSFEPNECSAQAAALPKTAAGSSPIAASASIGPLTTDVDYYQVAAATGHYFVTLLDADAAMCSGVSGKVSDLQFASTTFDYYGETGGGPLSCVHQSAQVANPTYGLAVLDFNVSDGDYPGIGSTPFTVPTNRGWAANRIDTSDWDLVTFRAAAPLDIRSQGAALDISVNLVNPANGSVIQTLSATCQGSLAPRTCISLTGSGTVEVRMTIRANSFPNLTAYRLDW